MFLDHHDYSNIILLYHTRLQCFVTAVACAAGSPNQEV